MKHLQKIITAAAVALAMSGLAQAADLKIGLIVPMSGPFASHGKQITNGIKLYLAQNGEVSLRTLTLLSSDADPGVAATAIRQTQARLGTTHDLRHRN